MEIYRLQSKFNIERFNQHFSSFVSFVLSHYNSKKLLILLIMYFDFFLILIPPCLDSLRDCNEEHLRPPLLLFRDLFKPCIQYSNDLTHCSRSLVPVHGIVLCHFGIADVVAINSCSGLQTRYSPVTYPCAFI